MKQLLYAVTFGAALSFASCSQPQAEAPEETPAVEQEPITGTDVTQKVIEHHLASFGANDIEALVSDYTDESVIITPDTIFKGIDGARAFFEMALPLFPANETSLAMDKMVFENNMGYILWHATTPSLDVSFGTDTFIVEDEKIVSQTFAGVMKPVEATN